jgi:spore coat polysaccharide biosynthesis protein SpsF
MSSQRFPGKALTPINGIPMLEYVLLRLKSWAMKSDVFTVLALEDFSFDFELVQIGKRNSDLVFDGKGTSPLDRSIELIKAFECDYFFRINADSPLIDTRLLSRALQVLNSIEKNETQSDLISNIVSRTFPYGISVELIKANSFLNHNKVGFIHPEHITQHLYRLPSSATAIKSIENEQDVCNTCIYTVDRYADSVELNRAISQIEEPGQFNTTWERLCRLRHGF